MKFIEVVLSMVSIASSRGGASEAVVLEASVVLPCFVLRVIETSVMFTVALSTLDVETIATVSLSPLAARADPSIFTKPLDVEA